MPAQRSFWRPWLLTFVLFATLMTLWSVATPLEAAPDEGSHIARAVSLVHGQWLGKSVPGPGKGAYTEVRVPATYASVNGSCYMGKPTVTAACIPRVTPSARIVSAPTHTGRYPPLYYLIVGLPSLFTERLIGIHLMRLTSALLSAAFLALAVATARRWSSSALLPAGIGVAATPMCLFMAGTVNPNGLEITATIALWTAGVVMVTEHLDAPPRALVAILGVSASVVALTRADSPLWLPVVAVVLAPLWLRRLRAASLRRPDVLAWSGVVGLAVIAALAWTFTAHALRVVATSVPAHHSTWSAVSVTVGQYPSLVTQEIGVFGWLDTPSPWITTTLWYFLIGASMFVAVLVGRTRQLVAVGLAIAAAVAVPILETVTTYGHDGFILQGRYVLPVSAGIPIVALGWVRSRNGDGTTRRLQISFAAAIAIAQFFAFYFALRRYRVGVDGPIFGSGSLPRALVWSPPLGTIPVEAAFLIACIAIVATAVFAPPRWAAPHPPDGFI
jgi:hypothetical protein